MNFPLEVNHTITLVTISSESWLTIAIKVSRGIYASCILVAIMAAVATFIDIWVRKWERTICGNPGKLDLISREETNYEMNWTGNSSWIREKRHKTRNLINVKEWIIISYYIDTSVLLENIPLVTLKKKLHPGPEWFILHNLTGEFIDDVISVITHGNFITYYFLNFTYTFFKAAYHFCHNICIELYSA